MNYKFSIVVAVYNLESLVERCLQSILKQTLRDVQIIIVDDASTDNSLQICQKYSEKDNRVLVIHHEVNSGLSEARNTGLRAAEGEYVFFVDGDDYIMPTLCQKAYERLETTKSDMVIFEAKYQRTNGKLVDMPIKCSKDHYINEEILDDYFPEIKKCL